MIGQVSSFHSFSTHDGPGIRATIFLQGCPLRCLCCHNPETWNPQGGVATSVEEIIQKVKKGLPYYKKGGITCSGGEPLMQPNFTKEIFTEAKKLGLHTTLDTSGCVLNEEVIELLQETDLVLLDIKKTTEEEYEAFSKGSLQQTIAFLNQLEIMKKPTWIRHVVIPEEENTRTLKQLKDLLAPYTVIEKVEFLPFKKLCLSKYEDMSLDFPLKNVDEMDSFELEQIKKWYKEG